MRGKLVVKLCNYLYCGHLSQVIVSAASMMASLKNFESGRHLIYLNSLSSPLNEYRGIIISL